MCLSQKCVELFGFAEVEFVSSLFTAVYCFLLKVDVQP